MAVTNFAKMESMTSQHREGMRAARLRARISQQKLANEVGQSYVTISRYESGARTSHWCRTRWR